MTAARSLKARSRAGARESGNYVFKLPFGEELQAGTGGRTTAQGYSGNDGVRQKFTQKERDVETGLDYFGARYYSSAQGRFTSPDDPFADWNSESPQKWNLYTYTSNNPLNRVDADGQRWAQQARGGKIHHEWFDDNEDENGNSPYKTALANGWSAVTDLFYTADDGRRIQLLSWTNEWREVSWLQEFYTKNLSAEAAWLRGKRWEKWWEQKLDQLEHDLDALPLAGGALRAGRGLPKLITRFRDLISKSSLRGKSLTAGAKVLRELGLNERITKTGRREFFDPKTGQVRAAYDAANSKGGNHWHKFAPDGTPINNGGRIVEKSTTAAHIPAK